MTDGPLGARVTRRQATTLAAALAAAGLAALRPGHPALAQDGTATPAAGTPTAGSAVATPPQPGYDGIRVAEDGSLVPYTLWVNLTPLLVTTPDGGAWAIFTARARAGESGSGTNRLYAARFDPKAGLWSAATHLPGAAVQFGPSAVVDAKGTVHLVFSARDSEASGVPSTLVHTSSADGATWSEPVPVAPAPNAGQQVMADITADAAGNLHVIWRDQRSSPPGVSPSQQGDGDLFVSDLVNGAWSAPVQVTGLDADGPDNVAWPHMDADGDRLVAIWSVYTQRATADPTRRADRVVWSSRPIAEPDGWAPAASLVEPQNGEVGSQLVDLVADPRGGLVAVSTRLNRGSNTVNGGPSLLLLPRGAGAWSPELSLAGGNLGYFPTVAVTADGVAYVAFNLGTGRRVEVGVVGATLDSGVVGPVVSPTAGESGEHGRPSLAIGTDGKPWIVYMHGETNSNSVELRASRDVVVPLQPGG